LCQCSLFQQNYEKNYPGFECFESFVGSFSLCLDQNYTYEIEPSHKESRLVCFPSASATNMSQLRRSVNVINPLIRTALVSNCRSIAIRNANAACNRTWLHTRSFMTTGTKLQQSQENSKDEQTLIYSAPNAPTVKLLKMFSVTSLGVKFYFNR
jgi:hypothetical protein